MKKLMPLALGALVTGMILGPRAGHSTKPRRLTIADSHYLATQRVANMVRSRHAQRLARAKKLRIVNVMWEDTGRFKGSSLGPNISDVTIEVESRWRGRTIRRLMPVVRYPNFTDKTADIKLGKLFIRVGNEKAGRALKTISLKQFLQDPTRYMSLPGKGRIKGKSLLARRDSHALVSAQHAFLPVRQKGKVKFYPVIFNYQSYRKNPAVLTLLVTRQGTSMTIIDNSRDTVRGSWGQRLFFNKNGKRAPLLAERLADVKARGTTHNGETAASLGKDANLLMLIQIPLKVKRRPRRQYAPSLSGGFGMGGVKYKTRRRSGSRGGGGLDTAVLGHGKTVGPYTELDGLTIQRDSRFPIRVTIQFYQATSTGEMSRAAMNQFARQIAKVYRKGDYVGSLVVPGKTNRPTEWTGVTRQRGPLFWWSFPGVVQWVRDNGRVPFYGPRFVW